MVLFYSPYPKSPAHLMDRSLGSGEERVISQLIIYPSKHDHSIGYAPYAAGLYMNSRHGTQWLELLGAALCGTSAGVFWMAETAVAIAYPEPWNRGKALGYWLTFRVSGQIVGGAVNLGLNAGADAAGEVSYTVYILFIAIQAAGPLVALFLNGPGRVQRRDGRAVSLEIVGNPWREMGETARLFCTGKFLSLVLFIGQAVFAEAVFFTYLSRKSAGNLGFIIIYQLTVTVSDWVG